MGAPAWLHCNLCMSQRCRGLIMTSCGKVVCSNCKPKLQSAKCKSCQGACNRTVQLNSKTPKEVTKLFTDLSSELKSVFKSIDFQNNQRRRILHYKKKKLNYGRSVIAKRRNDLKSKQNHMVTTYHEIEKKEQILLAQVEKAKKKIATSSIQMSAGDKRSSAKMPAQSHMQHLNPKIKRFSPIFGPAHIRRPNEVKMPLSRKRSHDELAGSQVLAGVSDLLNVSHKSEGDIRYGYTGGGGGGFLQMKTPAAWNKNKKFKSSFDKSEKVDSKQPLQVYKFFSPQ